MKTIIRDLTAQVERLTAFVKAYDEWRAAEDAAALIEDHGPYEEAVRLCEAEAKAQMVLIKAREALNDVKEPTK